MGGGWWHDEGYMGGEELALLDGADVPRDS